MAYIFELEGAQNNREKISSATLIKHTEQNKKTKQT